MIAFNVYMLSGNGATIMAPIHCSLGSFRKRVQVAFGLEAHHSLRMFAAQCELTPDAATLEEISKLHGGWIGDKHVDLHVVIVRKVAAKRYIYTVCQNWCGFRGPQLSHTDEVQLEPLMALEDQAHTLFPCKPGNTPDVPRAAWWSIYTTANGAPPKYWEQCASDVSLFDRTKTAEQVFGASDLGIVVLLPTGSFN